MTPHDWPYILDNGAYRAFKRGEPWDVDAFVGRVAQLDTMPRDPDFVVLPDCVASPERTRERSEQWAGVIHAPTAYAVQDGCDPEDAVDFADRVEAVALFVGGTVRWKRTHAEEVATAAHDHGLRCHIGRPNDLTWAKAIGADSVDTSTIVRDGAWHKLEQLEQQQTLGTPSN